MKPSQRSLDRPGPSRHPPQPVPSRRRSRSRSTSLPLRAWRLCSTSSAAARAVGTASCGDGSSTTISSVQPTELGRALTLGKCGPDPPVTMETFSPGSPPDPAPDRAPPVTLTCCEPAPGRATCPQRPAVVPSQREPFGPRSGPNGNPLYTLLRGLSASFAALSAGHVIGRAVRRCNTPQTTRPAAAPRNAASGAQTPAIEGLGRNSHRLLLR